MASNVHVIVTDPQPYVHVGPNSTVMTCPFCKATISTDVEAIPSIKTHVFAFLLCAIGCFCCAPCVYCADSCMSKKHTCPNCHKFIGMYDK